MDSRIAAGALAERRMLITNNSAPVFAPQRDLTNRSFSWPTIPSY